MSLEIVIWIASLYFAWAIGTHYTGAALGPAVGAGLLRQSRALCLMAIFAFAGAFFSFKVQETYAFNIVSNVNEVAVAAALLTTLYTYLKIPTSTIQLFTFSLVGAALITGLSIGVKSLLYLVIFWVVAPFVAFSIGLLVIRLLPKRGMEKWLRYFVIGSSMHSAFAVGSNDVSNAVSMLLALDYVDTITASLIGGAFISLGVLTWGRRVLGRVSREIVKMKIDVACTAQIAKASTIIGINLIGYNASINQTLISGLLGASIGKKEKGINFKVIKGILIGWGVSPASGLIVSVVISLILLAVI
ncbi:MAG: inorganic phosphate transporter [Thaumarchaeota archaeon]|nr:inorganic phosphate transporter [Nitrososphaerota archaeon]